MPPFLDALHRWILRQSAICSQLLIIWLLTSVSLVVDAFVKPIMACSIVRFFDRFPPGVFPAAAALTATSAYLTSAATAYALGHASGFVQIDAATRNPPESSVFSFLMSLHTVLMFVTVWKVYETRSTPNAVHGWSCMLGYLATLGGLITATVQGPLKHKGRYVGTRMHFIFGTIYVWLIMFTSPCLKIFRLLCALTATVCLALELILDTTECSSLWTQADHPSPKGECHYQNLTAAVAEWLLTFTIIIFVMSLVKDIQLAVAVSLSASDFTPNPRRHSGGTSRPSDGGTGLVLSEEQARNCNIQKDEVRPPEAPGDVRPTAAPIQ